MKRIIAIQGGLGNQMFEYAFYLALKEKTDNIVLNDYLLRREIVHNGCELNQLFGIQIPRIWYNDLIIFFYRKLYYTSLCQSLYGRTAKSVLSFLRSLGIGVCVEPEHGIFYPAYFSDTYLLYWSTWHSEKYFSAVRSQVLSAFKFREELLNERSRLLVDKIRSKESVSVHVRRGDYFLDDTSAKMYGNICTIPYYNRALKIVREKIKKPSFFIFSDDMEWVKEKLDLPEDAIFIDWNKKGDSWQDMYLMSQSKHNIIANSTFSWWSAWLNNHPDKLVICPDKILNDTNPVDLMPANWIVLRDNKPVSDENN